MRQHNIQGYRDGIVCKVTQKHSIVYIYIQSTCPIYMLKHKQSSQSPEYIFYKIVQHYAGYDIMNESSSCLFDTHVIDPGTFQQIKKVFQMIDVTRYASYNDVLAARMGLLKHIKSKLRMN